MKMISILALTALVAMASNANAQNQPNKSTPNPIGPEGSAGDAVGQISVGGLANFTGQNYVTRLYADGLFGVKLNQSSYWTAAMVMGSAVDANNSSIFIKPDFGFLFRNQYSFVDLTFGPSILYSFLNSNTWYGFHYTVEPGLRCGPIQLGIPFSIGEVADRMDWFTVLSVGADLGVQF